ncbi:methyltransferase domain-containing protein [Methylomonas sp. UP202]|uniref:class I SAM-dependent methyltransferase n=1 Tax=Methylomonas sp. UP202 TaxID=3040943 RepID=UPI0024798395|nr:methyltransferase domain-containing protein [Methylomonas sp. UP202]WGS83991.1 methyltransferase domain-containing protein [Methylomonas sp. UP202]
MTVKEHYDRHLGEIYAWMVGDFDARQIEHQHFLEANDLSPHGTAIALDLGAGHGIQSASLAKLGYTVKAIDFNQQLLSALIDNTQGLSVTGINDDIRQVKKYADPKPELIICWGDTLTHIESLDDIRQLLTDCCVSLIEGGKLVLSFRDYSTALSGDQRFIPVKSDDTKILTCCLDYEADRVRVTDLLQVKTENGWQQKVSSYYKVRVSPDDVVKILTDGGLKVAFNKVVNRMTTIIATKAASR